MKKQIIENVVVYYNDYKIEQNDELKDFLKSSDFSSFLSKIKLSPIVLDSKIVVILWWDWTFLEVIKKLYKNNYFFLGINFWNKGFLLNDKNILRWEIWLMNSQYSILKCLVDWKKTICFNDFDIKAWDWKMVWFDIFIWKDYKLNILWDWLLISTPAWSTGYNSSLSWPILPHNLNSFVITPKAPWKPKFQLPIILNDDEVVTLRTVWRQVPVEIYSDGKIFTTLKDNKEHSIIIKKSKYKINILTTKENINVWKNKVLQEQWFTRINLK